MSTTKKILSCLAQDDRFKGQSRSQGLIISHSGGYFLQGLAIERTSYKATFYIWVVVFSWFHPTDSLGLEFGFRLQDGAFFEGDSNAICARIFDALEQDSRAREWLFEPMTPDRFLSQNHKISTYPQHAPAATVFDIAALTALAGGYAHARQLLVELQTRIDYLPPESPLRNITVSLLDCPSDKAAIEAVLHARSIANKQKLLPTHMQEQP